MKNPLKYRPLVNQVELSYWNPQPNLIEVRTTTLPATTAFNGMQFSVGEVTKSVVGSLFAVRRNAES